MKAILKLVLFVGFCWFLGSLFSDDKEDTTTTETSTSTSSDLKVCPIHGKSYSENNVYGGCPECKKEEKIRATEKARQRASHL
ncbi:hypothetical protein [Sphingobacterium multivorum]|uniref:hypothetical protein n=1 Tax=Sphingobacterium multivorum TaxID=28454 RepID=UPI002897C54F|nr:hypothetical protein [Sphingobacterium multivorum]